MQEPFELLYRMQQESLSAAPGLPEETQLVEHWSGIGFRIDDFNLVAYLDQISEVLVCPDITPVPGTKSWMKGVVNVRGALYSVIDLPEYLGKKPVHRDKAARILVLNRSDVSSALLVPEVFGLRHFEMNLERQDAAALQDPIVPYLSGAFLNQGQLWGIFDVNTIAEAESFRHLAA